MEISMMYRRFAFCKSVYFLKVSEIVQEEEFSSINSFIA
jgi:hypothetical protein